jgi:hypothetical protein
MALRALLVLALFETVLSAVTDGPSTIPSDFNVVKASDNQTVKLSSLLDSSRSTLLYFPTDQCTISRTNMEYLSGLADSNSNVVFIAVLRFLSNTAREFTCGADRYSCTSDSGSALNEVAGYLPAGSKVILVQDLFKEAASGTSGGCDDGGVSNCASYTQYCGNAAITVVDWTTECRLTCGVCTAAAPTPAPAFTTPSCSSNSCGGVWNQYGSDGQTQSAWDIKEEVVVYAADGSYLGTVPSPSQPYPAKDAKVWDSAMKTIIEVKITEAGGGASNATTTTTVAPIIASANHGERSTCAFAHFMVFLFVLAQIS